MWKDLEVEESMVKIYKIQKYNKIQTTVLYKYDVIKTIEKNHPVLPGTVHWFLRLESFASATDPNF